MNFLNRKFIENAELQRNRLFINIFTKLLLKRDLKIILNKEKSILFDLIMPISMWLVLGIGFLIKGPISLVVFIFTLSSYVLWSKDINLLKNIRPFWGVICFMIIVLPWVYICLLYTSPSPRDRG